MAEATAPVAIRAPDFRRVPRAEGSPLQAWVAAGYVQRDEDKRRTIAAWAGATTNARLLWSLMVAVVIDFCSGYMSAIFNATKGRLGLHAPGNAGIVSGLTGAAFQLIEFFTIALTTTTLVVVYRYGHFRWRFMRILRPWALVQPAIAVAGILITVLLPLTEVPEGSTTGTILDVIFQINRDVPLLSILLLLVLTYIVGLAKSALAVGAYRFLRDLTLILLLTWVATYLVYYHLVLPWFGISR